MEINKTTQALLYLMRCALNATVPKQITELNYEALYKLASFHSVTAMIAMALESGHLLTEPYASEECIKKWKETRVKAKRKNILLDTERELLLEQMELMGIWYLPLKGSILKEMYPKLGMRQMADNDILFDAAYAQQVKDLMIGRGYKVIAFGRGNHDVYEKEPIYNFEFHTALFDEIAHSDWAAYYENIYERLLRLPGTNHGCCFSNEDFYIYLILHAYKHFDGSGNGVRFLSDLYVFLQKERKNLDWSYMLAELKKLGIDEFEEQVRKLTFKLFSPVEEEEIFMETKNNLQSIFVMPLTEKEKELLLYMIGSGTYGTIDNFVDKELHKLQGNEETLTVRTKIKYTLHRIFPDIEFMKQYSQFCRKHPWSFPFFWLVRWYRAATVRRKEVLQELKAIRK